MPNKNNPMVTQGTKFQNSNYFLTFNISIPISSHVEIETYIFHVDPPLINFLNSYEIELLDMKRFNKRKKLGHTKVLNGFL
jgi:hypothetical protein